jgi:hypothetical protein
VVLVLFATFIRGLWLYARFESMYHITMLIEQVLLRQPASQWPLFMHRPWMATSLRVFWSVRWHQFFRYFFVVFGARPGGALLGMAWCGHGCLRRIESHSHCGPVGGRAREGVEQQRGIPHLHACRHGFGELISTCDRVARERVVRLAVDHGMDALVGLAFSVRGAEAGYLQSNFSRITCDQAKCLSKAPSPCSTSANDGCVNLYVFMAAH